MESLSPEAKILMYIALLKKEGKITTEEVDFLKGNRPLKKAPNHSFSSGFHLALFTQM